nr:MAG TPA: hypothetical protein [Caudoviricetes sp.]
MLVVKHLVLLSRCKYNYDYNTNKPYKVNKC